MDAPPIVHIGYHKTGTSWFQKRFYPAVSNGAYIDRRTVREAFLNTTAFGFDPAHAKELLASEARPILCEEGLSGYFGNSGLLEALSKDVAYRIQAVYPNAQIVIFIRHQLEAIRASYLQYVRGGGTRSLRRFLFPYAYDHDFANRWHKKPLFSLNRYAYQHLIRHYRSVFGADNVHVFLYEDFAADPAGFARRFAARFGLEVAFERLGYDRRNPSFGWVSLQLARLTGPFFRWDTPDRLTILPVLPKWLHKGGIAAFDKTPLRGPRVTTRRLFGPRLYRELHDRFAEANRVLAEELDLGLAAYGYPLAPLAAESSEAAGSVDSAA